jgi:hypothetical protein
MPNHLLDTVEGKRLANRDDWLRWGPYLAERQWGTVREDYSADGNAWTYFPFDHAKSRVYRWGEDGIAGWTDDRLRWCLSLALWNGKDPILKERMFGLTNAQGNHGEDVKELYYYLDGTPTHSYMRMLYKYPQAEFPYAALIAENARRGRDQPEYELLDTGIFDENRYFDVTVEYAKAAPEDILIRISIDNRGPTRRTCTCCRSFGRATPGSGGRASRSRGCIWRMAACTPGITACRTAASTSTPTPSGCSAATKPTRSCCIGSRRRVRSRTASTIAW